MNMKHYQKILPTPRNINIFDDVVKHGITNLNIYNGIQHGDASITLSSFDEKGGEETNQDILANQGVLHAGLSCLICKITFETAVLQREHFKLDWHRFNAKQKLLARSPVSEDEFEAQVSGELSSISGSDSETDDDLEPVTLKKIESIDANGQEEMKDDEYFFFVKHPSKRFYVTEDGNLISLSRNVALSNQGNDVVKEILQGGKAGCIWIYLMLSAGHFAGAVFERNKLVAHKTFHRYTVRAKRGTTQSVQDKKQGHSKSAGASIRRYNEAALVQDIQLLLVSWSKFIKEAEKIFFKCASYSKNTLFGDNTLLNKVALKSRTNMDTYSCKKMKLPQQCYELHSYTFIVSRRLNQHDNDKRVRKISVMTRRPTLKEVQRINNIFNTIEIYGSVASIEESLQNVLIQEDYNKSPKKKSYVSPEQTSENCDPPTPTTERCLNENEINTENKNTSKKKKKKETSKQVPDDADKQHDLDVPVELDENILLWNEVYQWCIDKNFDKLQKFLDPISKEQSVIDGPVDSKNIIFYENENASCNRINNGDSHCSNISSEIRWENDVSNGICLRKEALQKRRCFLENGYLTFCSQHKNETLLHAAVKSSCKAIIPMLLLAGADPSIKNSQGKVPYDVAMDKEVRNEFRRFMGRYPDKYDYKTANIPSPLTEELEKEQQKRSADKKKAQIKARRDRLKVKKSDERQQKLAEKEQKAFDALSDREKRAAMAERRFASQLTDSLRCSHCRKSIAEKDAFQRYDFKYCSTSCVQAHKIIIGK